MNLTISKENIIEESITKAHGFLEELKDVLAIVFFRLFRIEIAYFAKLIKEWIIPGSLIISDGWALYSTINDIDDGVYSHEVIVHKKEFVNSDFPEIHTQNIENLWMRSMRKLKHQFGTGKHLLSSYLIEFVWRQRINKSKSFQHILIAIGELFCLRN